MVTMDMLEQDNYSYNTNNDPFDSFFTIRTLYFFYEVAPSKLNLHGGFFRK